MFRLPRALHRPILGSEISGTAQASAPAASRPPRIALVAGEASGDLLGGLHNSQRVLLALTQAGLTRDDSYRLVQRNAMKVWEADGALNLLDLLKADADVTARLAPEQLDQLFDLGYHFKHVDTIFARVFA